MPCAVLKSSVGKKAIMAISGLALFGFVIAHLMGNLLIFAGPDALNAYASKLAHLGPILWIARIGLLAMVAAHIATSVMITIENREAKPIGYEFKANHQLSYAARTMMISGVLVLAFIIYHLLHFTFRVTNPDISNLHDALGRHDVYSMVVSSFKQAPISWIYIVSMFLLCSHLSHGISSMIQTLGLNNEKSIRIVKHTGRIIALLIFFGYISIPLAVITDYIRIAGTP